MKPENRETTAIELAAVFYVRKRKNPFSKFLCNVARSHAIAQCCKNPLNTYHGSFNVVSLLDFALITVF